jgi:ectoine hydroxylase-related dioxygenase (phytanoyl-CoA dioxygenase family)
VTSALQDNGAPGYIHASHLGEVLPHRVVQGVGMIECSTEPDTDEARSCPIVAGSVLIHSGRTVHGSDHNRTGPDCLAYVMIFATPPVRRADTRAFPWLEQLGVDRAGVQGHKRIG